MALCRTQFRKCLQLLSSSGVSYAGRLWPAGDDGHVGDRVLPRAPGNRNGCAGWSARRRCSIPADPTYISDNPVHTRRLPATGRKKLVRRCGCMPLVLVEPGSAAVRAEHDGFAVETGPRNHVDPALCSPRKGDNANGSRGVWFTEGKDESTIWLVNAARSLSGLTWNWRKGKPSR